MLIMPSMVTGLQQLQRFVSNIIFMLLWLGHWQKLKKTKHGSFRQAANKKPLRKLTQRNTTQHIATELAKELHNFTQHNFTQHALALTLLIKIRTKQPHTAHHYWTMLRTSKLCKHNRVLCDRTFFWTRALLGFCSSLSVHNSYASTTFSGNLYKCYSLVYICHHCYDNI